MKIQSINPATEEMNATFDTYTKEQVNERCKKVSRAFDSWKQLSIDKRGEHFLELASILRKNKEKYARFITQEMGKPIMQSRQEIEGCAKLCEMYTQRASEWLASEIVEPGRKYIRFEPSGVVLAIMPWNFPFSQALRCIVPAMMAGNVCLLRHSNRVPLCALAIEDAFKGAGMENFFHTLITDYKTVDNLIKSSYIHGIAVTASIDVGSRIAAQAGKRIKKVVL